ncbi:hypothetical protein [Embleya scabrispora]|uniref:hypothetical protein n=1 Tax=Embleya scabrispora TaxID=159449 RepID=UPI00037E0A6E|nr:hypothetical protein [Embleya scabrispora]MYS84925.1 hypothetical protein [Streptomyces sp. SID5474]
MPEISPADAGSRVPPVLRKQVPQVPVAPDAHDQPADETARSEAARTQWLGALYAFGYIGLARTAQAEFDLDGVAAALPLYALSVAAAGLTDGLGRRLTDRLARRGLAVPRACRAVGRLLAACVPPAAALPWLAPDPLIDVTTRPPAPVDAALGCRLPVPEQLPNVAPPRRHRLLRRRPGASVNRPAGPPLRRATALRRAHPTLGNGPVS